MDRGGRITRASGTRGEVEAKVRYKLDEQGERMVCYEEPRTK
jgi:hypothetical protein